MPTSYGGLGDVVEHLLPLARDLPPGLLQLAAVRLRHGVVLLPSPSRAGRAASSARRSRFFMPSTSSVKLFLLSPIGPVELLARGPLSWSRRSRAWRVCRRPAPSRPRQSSPQPGSPDFCSRVCMLSSSFPTMPVDVVLLLLELLVARRRSARRACLSPRGCSSSRPPCS